MLRNRDVLDEEVYDITDQITRRQFSMMFDNFQAYDVQETRRVSREEGRLEGRIEGERAGRIEGERTGRIEGEQLHLIKLVIKKIEREMKTDRLSISQKKEQYGNQIIRAAIFNNLFNMFNIQN